MGQTDGRISVLFCFTVDVEYSKHEKQQKCKKTIRKQIARQ